MTKWTIAYLNPMKWQLWWRYPCEPVNCLVYALGNGRHRSPECLLMSLMLQPSLPLGAWGHPLELLFFVRSWPYASVIPLYPATQELGSVSLQKVFSSSVKLYSIHLQCGSSHPHQLSASAFSKVADIWGFFNLPFYPLSFVVDYISYNILYLTVQSIVRCDPRVNVNNYGWLC